MTDVKKLLAEATPRPWIDVMWCELAEHEPDHHPGHPDCDYRPHVIGHGRGRVYLPANEADAELIVRAVNHLPDYEALREIVEAMWDSVENDSGPSSLAKDLEWEQRWSNVSNTLARLRGEA